TREGWLFCFLCCPLPMPMPAHGEPCKSRVSDSVCDLPVTGRAAPNARQGGPGRRPALWMVACPKLLLLLIRCGPPLQTHPANCRIAISASADACALLALSAGMYRNCLPPLVRNTAR